MRWLLASVLASLALVGPAAGATPPLPNPCSLLLDAQLVPVLGGAPTHVASGNGFDRMCTWTGPPLGYMQEREQFTVSVVRVTRAQFALHAYKDIPKPDPVPNLGSAAFSEFGGEFVIWQNGVQLDLVGSYISVYPKAGERLARSALKRL